MKRYAIFSKLPFSKSPGAILMHLALAVVFFGLAMMQGSCRQFEKGREEVDFKSPPEPQQLVDSLIQSGDDLRRLDMLELERSAGLGSSERERVQSRISGVASGHVRKYREHLFALARFPQKRVNDELKARLASGKTNRELPEIVKVIELHLRLVRADNPPSESRIIWDFGNLRYAEHRL